MVSPRQSRKRWARFFVALLNMVFLAAANISKSWMMTYSNSRPIKCEFFAPSEDIPLSS